MDTLVLERMAEGTEGRRNNYWGVRDLRISRKRSEWRVTTECK